jgi:hypothetical protein
MKKVTLLLVFALVAFPLLKAQSNKEEVDLMQAAFGMEKKSMVAEFVKVDATQKDAFWKIYDEYEAERKILGKQRIDLLNKYAENFDKMTNESADKMAGEIISLSEKTDKMLISYYGKVKKATNPIVAFQFYQVESYILTGIRMFIQEQLPLPHLKNK